MTPANPLKQARALHKQGKTAAALQLLRDALRRNSLDPVGVERAGSLALKLTAEGEDTSQLCNILLLGQLTTSWLKNCLAAHALADDKPCTVSEGDYDNVLQELLQAHKDTAPDTVILLPWNQRLLGNSNMPPEQRIEAELEFWSQAWALVSERLQARIVQLGYDWVDPGAAGYLLAGTAGGAIDAIRRLNDRLRNALPAGSCFIDLPAIAGEMGRRHFYQPRRYHWTRQPFSEAGSEHLARHLWAGIRAITHGPRKVLVLDLDNTLWGGVVGETGPLDITLGESPDGEAYRSFQQLLKELSGRGILLAIASKNNREDALGAFHDNPEMILQLDDFAAIEANWNNKADSLVRIAGHLNLGLDSLVFFDDNPAERELIRQRLPQVAVVEVPDEPALFRQALLDSLCFEHVTLTGADLQRTDHYRAEDQRQQVRQQFNSMADYLQSLQMEAEVRPLDEQDLPRALQLLGKTNQFNLTTRRHGREVVSSMMGDDDAICLTLRLRDRFGDYGLVSVLLAVAEQYQGHRALRIDSWLLSCRAIGRTVEQHLFGSLLQQARSSGWQMLVGEYRSSAKNAQVSDLYPRLGFTQIDSDDNGSHRYLLLLEGAEAPASHVAPQR